MRPYHDKSRYHGKGLVSEGLQMWYQVEVWLDGGVLARTSPFGQTSLVPQMRRYHAKLKFVVRRASDVVLSRKLAGWGCTWSYIPIQADEGSAADDPLSQQRANLLSEERQIQRSANFEAMGCT